MTEIPALGESDWEEEDLLTLSEAGERLREELGSELAVLDAPGVDPDAAGAQRARVRIAAIRSRLRYIDAGLARGEGTIRRTPTA